MIYETLTCLAGELNEHFRMKLKITEDKAIVSSIVNQDGSVAIPGENKIAITLINLEREQAAKNNSSPVNGKSFSGTSSPSLALNLYVLCSAYFTGPNYTEGLRFIAFIISFLQQKTVFTAANTPALPPNIDKLIFDMETVGLERQSNLWSMLGGKYMPSILYKIRMLVFDSDKSIEYRPVISGAQKNTKMVS